MSMHASTIKGISIPFYSIIDSFETLVKLQSVSMQTTRWINISRFTCLFSKMLAVKEKPAAQLTVVFVSVGSLCVIEIEEMI